MKMAQFPDYDWPSDDQLNKIRSFTEFDHLLTAKVHGFASGKDYYQQCSCGAFLRSIAKPTLIVHAKDDPFMTEESIPAAASLSDHVTLEISQFGGHMGFLRHKRTGGLDRYLDDRLQEWFKQKHTEVRVT